MAVKRLPSVEENVRNRVVDSESGVGREVKTERRRIGELLNGRSFYRWCFPVLFYLFVLTACGFFVRPDSAWFVQLAKPSFLLSNCYLFPITVAVYVCMTVSLLLLVRVPMSGRTVLETGVGALLQLLWCVFFFAVKSPFAALSVNVLLLIHTAILMSFVRKRSPQSFLWMLPFYVFLIYVAVVCYVILMLY